MTDDSGLPSVVPGVIEWLDDAADAASGEDNDDEWMLSSAATLLRGLASVPAPVASGLPTRTNRQTDKLIGALDLLYLAARQDPEALRDTQDLTDAHVALNAALFAASQRTASAPPDADTVNAEVAIDLRDRVLAALADLPDNVSITQSIETEEPWGGMEIGERPSGICVGDVRHLCTYAGAVARFVAGTKQQSPVVQDRAPAPLLPVTEEPEVLADGFIDDDLSCFETGEPVNVYAVAFNFCTTPVSIIRRAILAGAAQHEEGPLPATPPEG